jgi:hypothetical protein
MTVASTHIPKRRGIQSYDRLKTLSLEEGFGYIASGARHVEIDGVRVKVNSMRLRSFLQNGVKCAYEGCPYEATFFAVERDATNPHKNYHLNLWGIAHDGLEVLFTHDHIVARGLGGPDTLENTQTMCCWHNWMKGNKEGQIVNANWKTTRREFYGNTLSFTYVSAEGKEIVMRATRLVRKTFNFYLNDPMTWDTNKFLEIIWKHAGFRCSEVKLVNNSYIHPELKLLAHRYDLFFVTGDGIIKGKDAVNDLMRKIETDIRANLNVTMIDTHFLPKQKVVTVDAE